MPIEPRGKMPTVCTNAIVTGYTDYKENDRILTLFTLEHGRVDCKARNCRKPTAPLLSCAQPFVYGEFELYMGNERATVNGCDVKESFYPIREDVDRFLIASAVTQLCGNAIEHDAPNPPLFSLLYHTLSYLAYGDCVPQDLLCGFLIRYLDRLGYCPSLTACASCHRDVRSDAVLYFVPRAGGVVCAACPHGTKPVSRLALEAMRRMLLLEDEELQKIVLKEPLRAELLALLTATIEEVLGDDRAVRTLHQL